MKELASHHFCLKHTVHMLDDFDLEGPNGSHKCLVYELLGPNIPDTIDAHFPDGRLPGKLAKVIAKQSLIGLDSLHRQNIGHGDLHTRNLAFTMPYMDNVTEEGFTEMLGKPEIGYVRRSDGKDLAPGIPEYIVKPTSYRTHSWNSAQSIKIIDFGESFLPTAIPQTLHTPLALRAPEVIFQDRIDYRVDLWSMGCMLFELFTGQPPFDTFLITPTILVGQMREMASDDLPERWQGIWDTMNAGDGRATENTGPSLQKWLEEVYFEGLESPDLTREDIQLSETSLIWGSEEEAIDLLLPARGRRLYKAIKGTEVRATYAALAGRFNAIYVVQVVDQTIPEIPNYELERGVGPTGEPKHINIQNWSDNFNRAPLQS
ncbi:conserved hypothetical protein [Histoplasma mississippiense (nom. inval.)]|uniref:conserved hypothetical protein n=1 Tax=Ajellomyces capsulatus (strain NAm1 / WU24) TaxID=2059318 RepID=UPI000157C30A|nr:conserved hypothetical protein [Histoplasma mississippiense (nom. inval.)]EDN07449.1 conserved hypothetical protein [Histoplasma mississippiense (nom. inval.)]